ncbi:hypothetical protein PMY56_16905 [Clostridium tertium]|jgi:hypothetical protein|uniref:hypothetical protein n=2 Tax=Clostridiaceae TaxID=31979 RepID=UPI001157C94F|nr:MULTISPECIES: hypothetical protein [Clostridium]MBS5305371.1 hypothetical protein [Clostridium sp.]MDB1923445.1 hypothetical protein [Clostridium tertium]MDB1927812.1 hypothetical protein [Clostridium tertium]MDB1931315.1 hypothetical protein [Clostridium tertium]MDB1942624.1 hypothetical protein [Clostridium tertium]
MKISKKTAIIILAISIFLISDIIRVSANTSKDLKSIGLNTESFVEYMNNLDISKQDIEEIVDKGKELSENIKDKTNIKDFKISELINIYKEINLIANDLNLNIDFSFKDGNFNLKEKNRDDIIFKGNVNNLGEYFEFYKNNIQLFAKEVLGNIENKEILENIGDVVEEELGGSKETLNNVLMIDENEDTNDSRNSEDQNKFSKNNESNYNESKKGNLGIVFSIFILTGAFFTIMISYIKFRK